MLSNKIARGSRTVVQDWAFTSIIIEITRVFQAAAAGCILLLCIRSERSVVNDYVFEQTEGRRYVRVAHCGYAGNDTKDCPR
jgi:hypothetical protein